MIDIQRIKHWIKHNWDVYFWLPLAGVLFYFSQPILSFFSPTGAAGTFDGGILQPLLLAVITELVIVGVVVLLMKARFPQFLKVMEDEGLMAHFLTNENESTCVWQLLSLFLSLLFSLILLTGLYLLAGN